MAGNHVSQLSPRQRMINMMYLVLTALLALNVSKKVLDSFFKVDKSLTQTVLEKHTKNQSDIWILPPKQIKIQLNWKME